MKKLLALVLALVMTLSLCVVSSNAALDDFSDAADVSYEEAMSVMNAVGVFVGSDGKLAPKDNLTRAQAAKIITYLDLGETAAEALTKDVTAFSDVAAGNWAAGYITYCYNAGIIAGDGAGKFNPNDQVTALQFAKMLLVVLGYDAQREGLVGSDYALNTTKLAAVNDLFAENDGLSVNAPATREEAALYAFNALKAPTYAYDTASTTVKGANGLEVIVGGSNAKPVTTGANRGAITPETGTLVMQLGEKLYKGDLTLLEATDDMGRPSNNWSYKTKTVIKAEKSADYTVVVKKAGKTVADIIDNISKKYSDTPNTTYPAVFANDNIARINGGIAGTTATTALSIGDVVEVYMSDDYADLVTNVAVTRYTVGQLSADVITRTNDGVKQVRLPGIAALASWKDADDVEGYEGLEKDDVICYYQDAGATGDYHIAKAASFEGQLTSVQSNSTPNKYTIDGTQYITSAAAGISVVDLTTPVYNTTYTYYTDANGLIIFAEKVESSSKDYVYIDTLKYVEAGASIGADDSIEARIVKMDGSVEVVKVDEITWKNGTKYEDLGGDNAAMGTFLAYDTNGTASAVTLALNTTFDTAAEWRNDLYTYSVNSDGEYELKSAHLASGVTTANVATSAATTTYKANSSKLNGVAVNDSTVFVVVNDPTKSSPKFTVYTGKNAAPEFYSASANDLQFTYSMANSVATYVVVYNFGTKSVSGDWIYIASEKVGTTEYKKSSGSTTNYDLYMALKNGESDVKTIMVKNTMTLIPGLYESLSFDTDSGALIEATYSAAKNKGVNTVAPYAGFLIDGTTMNVGKTWTVDGSGSYTQNAFNLPSDAIVIYKDTDDVYTVGKPGEFVNEDGNDLVFVSTTNASDGKVKVLYIEERDVDNADLFGFVQTDTTGAYLNIQSADGLVAGTSTETNYTYKTYAWNASATTGTASTDKLVIFADAGAKIEVATNDANLKAGTLISAFTSNAFTNVPGATGAHTYYVRVTAEDNSEVGYYKVTITT